VTLSPLKRFFLAALLWLPLAFFLWFAFAAALSWPVIALAKTVLLKAWPGLDFQHASVLVLLDAQGRILARSQKLGTPDPAFLAQVRTTASLRSSP